MIQFLNQVRAATMPTWFLETDLVCKVCVCICLSVCLSICLAVCLGVCLSILEAFTVVINYSVETFTIMFVFRTTKSAKIYVSSIKVLPPIENKNTFEKYIKTLLY